MHGDPRKENWPGYKVRESQEPTLAGISPMDPRAIRVCCGHAIEPYLVKCGTRLDLACLSPSGAATAVAAPGSKAQRTAVVNGTLGPTKDFRPEGMRECARRHDKSPLLGRRQ